jgi:hypothetical protein
MFQKSLSRRLISLVRVSLILMLLLGALNLSSTAFASSVSKGIEAPTAYVTTITVNSGTDPDDHKSKTCLTDTPCTLRRAIVQARGLGASQRPVLIQFDIPQDSQEGYDSSLGIWKINVYKTLDTTIFRTIYGGGVTIDGTTQPGGRSSGPKIFIVGPTTGQKNGLVVGENDAGGHDANVIRGLGFQNLQNHVTVNSNNNIIEDNWFGLSDDGSEPYLLQDDPQQGSGESGVSISGGSPTGNIIQDNYFLGLDGVAAAIRGDANTFAGNYVGTTANGDIPDKQTDPTLICTPVDWLGGGGLTLDGDDHTVDSNVFAGLRQEIYKTSTQPDAIMVTGEGHIVQNNKIGIAGDDTEVGVCGRGIYMSDGPKEIQVLNNSIVDPGYSAISLNGVLYDENTLQGNTIKKSTAWPEIEGNPEKEDAIQVGPSIPEEFRMFYPAKVTEIDGTTVKGTAGDNSPCPNCVVEIFLDDTDNIVEALQSLDMVTAGSDGKWTATIPVALTKGQGLRTLSTTAKYNTIPYMNAGTTTQLSVLYKGGYEIFLPLVVR